MNTNKILTIGALLLSCSLFAVAQSENKSNQTDLSTTPCACQQYSNPQAIANEAKNFRPAAVQGCLVQTRDGRFAVADIYGGESAIEAPAVPVRGDSAQLSAYVGKEVRVNGIVGKEDLGSMPSSMASPQGVSQLNVSSVDELHDSCAYSEVVPHQITR